MLIGFRAEVDMVLFNFCKMAVLYSSNSSFLTWVLILHNSSKCNEQSIAAIDKDEYTGAYCQLRNNAPLEQVQGGMGDIFIKMARD